MSFVNLVDAGDPVESAMQYDKQGADELVFLDITASSDSRNITIDMVEKVANSIFIPFTVGGVNKIYKTHTFYNSAVFYIKTWNYSFCVHIYSSLPFTMSAKFLRILSPVLPLFSG